MWGMVLSVVYDVIRIFRRVIIHHKVPVLVAEDILFWMASGFVIFHVTFMVNNGIIRSFSIVGFIIGSAMYQYTVSYYLVKYISRIIIFVIKPLKKLVKSITMVLKRLRMEKKPDEKIRDKEKQRIKNKKTEKV